MFYFILNIGRSDLRMFARNVLQTCLGVPVVALLKKQQTKENPTEKPDHFRPF